MFVCLCYGVTDKHIKSAVKEGCCSYRDVRQSTRVGTQCGKCACMAKQMVRDELASLAATLDACCQPKVAEAAPVSICS